MSDNLSFHSKMTELLQPKDDGATRSSLVRPIDYSDSKFVDMGEINMRGEGDSQLIHYVGFEYSNGGWRLPFRRNTSSGNSPRASSPYNGEYPPIDAMRYDAEFISLPERKSGNPASKDFETRMFKKAGKNL